MSSRISPSILAADFANLEQELGRIRTADFVHVDIMDNHFVPNLTFGPPVVSRLAQVSPLPFDMHLMIEHPEQYVSEFVKAGLSRGGGSMVTIHPETTFHLNRVLHQIKDAGAKAGVALNPATPLSAIEWVLGDLDHVLVMTVNPGFGGQAFLPEMLQKIRALSELRAAHGLRFEIGVDGGVNADTAPLVARAGADVLIAGSAVFHHPEGLADAVAELRRLATGAAAPPARNGGR